MNNEEDQKFQLPKQDYVLHADNRRNKTHAIKLEIFLNIKTYRLAPS